MIYLTIKKKIMIDFGRILVFLFSSCIMRRYRIDAAGIQIYPVYILLNKSTCVFFATFDMAISHQNQPLLLAHFYYYDDDVRVVQSTYYYTFALKSSRIYLLSKYLKNKE